MKSYLTPFVLITVALALAVSRAADWPQWRGPHRDSVVADSQHRLDSLSAEPKVLWKIAAGDGHASPVVAGGKLVYLDSQAGNETAHCVDAATGKQLWSVPVGPLVEFSNYGSGPRCTPMIDGDRVYAQSSGGEFRCLALADGKTLWEMSFAKDYGVTFLGNRGNDPAAKETASRRHGNDGSGAIDGDRVFLPVGGVNGATLVCLDKMTGKEQWRAGNDNTAYSSVMVATLAGARQAVHFTADALMGVDVATGKILWREALRTNAKRHACTPIISGDTVTVASTSLGTVKFRIVNSAGAFKPEKVWENTACKTVIGTPTLLGKNLFTLGPGNKTELTCLDFETGKQLWAQPGLADYASITAVNDKLLVLNSTGELTLVKANPAKYELLGRAQVCGKTWTSPAYVDGKIYVKDGASVTALAVAQ